MGEDVGGIAVHIAARVGALADGGEVLVSSTVKDLVAGSGIRFDDRGEKHLKGVPGDWRLFAAAPSRPRDRAGAESRVSRRASGGSRHPTRLDDPLEGLVQGARPAASGSRKSRWMWDRKTGDILRRVAAPSLCDHRV